MKAALYIAEWIKTKTSTVYGVQGGAAVHLFDACHEVRLPVVYTHGEQAAAFAALGHAMVSGFGVCITTTGPAATNAITPTLGAWQCSIPLLIISGQTRVANLSYENGNRQSASQEAPILNFVRPMTNAGVLVRDAENLPMVLQYAEEKLSIGRSGPVWIDFPVDQQWAEVP